MNGCHHYIIRNQGRSGFYMRHNQWEMRFYGFHEMPLKPTGGASFLAMMSVFVLKEADVERRGKIFSEKHATEPPVRCADQFWIQTRRKMSTATEPDGATRVPLDQGAASSNSLHLLSDFFGEMALLPSPKGTRGLFERGPWHSTTLVDSDHGASREPQLQDLSKATRMVSQTHRTRLSADLGPTCVESVRIGHGP